MSAHLQRVGPAPILSPTLRSSSAFCPCPSMPPSLSPSSGSGGHCHRLTGRGGAGRGQFVSFYSHGSENINSGAAVPTQLCVKEGEGQTEAPVHSSFLSLPLGSCPVSVVSAFIDCVHACVCARCGLGGASLTHFLLASRSPSSILIIPDVWASLRAAPPPFPSVFIICKPWKLSSASLPPLCWEHCFIHSFPHRSFICSLDRFVWSPRCGPQL